MHKSYIRYQIKLAGHSLTPSIKSLRKRYKLFREKPQIWFLPEQKLAYIQIPKIATRSIRHSLCQTINPTNQLSDDKQAISKIEAAHSKHMSTKHIAQLAPSWTIFAFVRNPYHRLYSCYKNKLVDAPQKGDRNIFKHYGMEFNMPFEDFVAQVCKIPDAQADRHFRSQCSFLTFQGQLLTNFIGQFENLSEDWQYLSQKYGLAPLPVKNPSLNNTNIENLLTTKLKRDIAKRYEQDFKLLNYQV